MSKRSVVQEYTAVNIEVLEGLDPVRKRPGMYIGGTEGPSGLHHLIKEILDNAVDEVMNGYANLISVTLHTGHGSISIEDNGRGIPVDNHPIHKRSALELILTTLHAGGKFSDTNYLAAGGLHGVGASVVNALSAQFTATVKRDGGIFEQSFAQGKPIAPVRRIGSNQSSLKLSGKKEITGTKIFFAPDPKIFRAPTFEVKRIRQMLEEKAFLNPGLKITFQDEDNDGKIEEFIFLDGVRSYLEVILQRNNLSKITDEIFFLERSKKGVTPQIEVVAALCWSESTRETLYSYVNGIHTAGGGSHEDGFRSGLSKALRHYIEVHNLLPKNIKLSGEDFREGLVAVLSVRIPSAVAELQFQGQTKDKLNNPESLLPVESTIKSLEDLFNSKPTVANVIIERVILAAKARAAARAASQAISRKVGLGTRLNLPGKLADCSNAASDDSELFIVEGDSAGGSAKQGRDRKLQAVLPLRGKILNSLGVSPDKISANKELMDLVSALGCGVGASLKLDKLRYGKVIILTDADADGMHIASLLMAFFFEFMRPIIDHNHLFVGISPLFRVQVGSGSQVKDIWVYNEAERDKVVKEHRSRKVQITRFKGLGEMNPQTLWSTTLNPATRNLLRIKIEDGERANIMFRSLLGKESGDRYRMIHENAHRLNLDL